MPKFMVLALLLMVLVAGLIVLRSHSRGFATVSNQNQSKEAKSGQASPLPLPPEGANTSDMSSGNSTDGGNKTEDKPPLNSTLVEVNGRKIIVPPNSSYSQTFNDPGSQTSVSVKSSQHSSQDGSGSSSSSSSSSSVQVNSQ